MAAQKRSVQNAQKSPAKHLNSATLMLLRILIGVILLAFLGGIIKTFFDLQLLITQSVGAALRQILLDVLTLLAVVEVLKTANGYLADGRVRVTFIVDTVLIVMLNEVISVWFKGTNIIAEAPLLLILLTLIIVRVLAIHWSPDGE
jgi:uncharacterized membrane protein (DUF373 family)